MRLFFIFYTPNSFSWENFFVCIIHSFPFEWLQFPSMPRAPRHWVPAMSHSASLSIPHPDFLVISFHIQFLTHLMPSPEMYIQHLLPILVPGHLSYLWSLLKVPCEVFCPFHSQPPSDYACLSPFLYHLLRQEQTRKVLHWKEAFKQQHSPI